MCGGVWRVILLLLACGLPSDNVWSVLAMRGATLVLCLTFLDVEVYGNKDKDWEQRNLVRNKV